MPGGRQGAFLPLSRAGIRAIARWKAGGPALGRSNRPRDARPPCRSALVLPCLVGLVLANTWGCGTTRWSDTKRTATEQLLVSDAIERAVDRIDLAPLSGRRVFLETAFLDEIDDTKYLEGELRHHILASGCRLAEKREDADVVVEARAGVIGTDRNDLLIGMPATSVSFAGSGTTIPELAAAKRTDQRAVAKVSLHAYERATGRALWQSGEQRVVSRTRDRWILGAGPFADGDVNDELEFAGERFDMPMMARVLGRPYDPDGTRDQVRALRVDRERAMVYAELPPPAGERASATADARPAALPPVR